MGCGGVMDAAFKEVKLTFLEFLFGRISLEEQFG